jgi:RNA polymerase sigma-70 factor (ECF subfamily)
MSSTEQASAEIARGLRDRNPEVLDGLIEQYHYRLLRYLIYLTGRREIAEDLFQETWLRVLERGRQYNGKTRFEIWLFAIARHLVIDFMRKKRLSSLEDYSDPEEGNRLFELKSTEPSPFDVAASNEDAKRVITALNDLEFIHREVMVLRFQEAMSLEEIALLVGAPLSTVKSRLYRGLDTLRSWLEGKKHVPKGS